MLAKDYMVSWLNNAYGMETSLYDHMSYDLPKVTGHHEIENKLLEFMDMGIRHTTMLDERIAALDGATSSTKRGGLPEFMGLMQHAWYASSAMQLVKKYVGTYAAAQYEVAMYKAIISAAQELHDDETADLCRQLLRDDEEMARWFMEHMRALIQKDMKHQQEGRKEGDESNDLINADGTLKTDYLYAVFDDEQTAQEAEEALSKQGTQARRMQGQEAISHLRGRSEQGGKIADVERTMKLPMGEPQQAEHYAGQLEEGRIVLGVPCKDHAEVDRLLPIIVQHGGYDATYFTSTTFEHLGTSTT